MMILQVYVCTGFKASLLLNKLTPPINRGTEFPSWKERFFSAAQEAANYKGIMGGARGGELGH